VGDRGAAQSAIETQAAALVARIEVAAQNWCLSTVVVFWHDEDEAVRPGAFGTPLLDHFILVSRARCGLLNP
jgi:hypothetical protein